MAVVPSRCRRVFRRGVIHRRLWCGTTFQERLFQRRWVVRSHGLIDSEAVILPSAGLSLKGGVSYSGRTASTALELTARHPALQGFSLPQANGPHEIHEINNERGIPIQRKSTKLYNWLFSI